MTLGSSMLYGVVIWDVKKTDLKYIYAQNVLLRYAYGDTLPYQYLRY